MSDLPTSIEIHEEGPREGFQIEPGPISTADKIRLIEALAETGLQHIQVCSFVNPAPGARLGRRRGRGGAASRPRPGVALHGAVVQRQRARTGARVPRQAHAVTARSRSRRRKASRARTCTAATPRISKRCASRPRLHLEKGVPVTAIGVMAAFGCNYQGDIAPAQVVRTLADGLAIAGECGVEITLLLAGRHAWAGRRRRAIERVVGEVRAPGRTSGSACTCTTRAAWPSPTPWPGCAWACAVSIPPSAASAAARSPARRARRATSAPRSW